MRCTVQVILETEAGTQVTEIASLERETAAVEALGLTLAEGKALLAGLQEVLVAEQAAEYLATRHACPQCGTPLRHNGHNQVVFRTLFGNTTLLSPRLVHCACSPHPTRTFSPLTELLQTHTSPERLYLETKWAALISFALTAQLMAEVLPVDRHINPASVRNDLQRVATPAEAALGEERGSFIDGCPREWAALPRPAAPLTVGIDGGFVRAWDAKQTHFEGIAGKSIPEGAAGKCFGFVQTYDTKPKRRLFELLKSQGMQNNQQVVFLSDGGDDVRELQLYLNPEAEHYLDWFHVTMRLTVLGQYAKGLPAEMPAAAVDDDDPGPPLRRDEIDTLLERIKHYLWHGNVVRALEEIDDLELDLDNLEALPEPGKKLARAASEFHTYIRLNAPFIPNYGERWRNQDTIASGFVESAVNQMISKRMVKRQQMQWTKRGAHLLVQMRAQVLNDDLDHTFCGWYPGFRTNKVERQAA